MLEPLTYWPDSLTNATQDEVGKRSMKTISSGYLAYPPEAADHTSGKDPNNLPNATSTKQAVTEFVPTFPQKNKTISADEGNAHPQLLPIFDHKGNDSQQNSKHEIETAENPQMQKTGYLYHAGNTPTLNKKETIQDAHGTQKLLHSNRDKIPSMSSLSEQQNLHPTIQDRGGDDLQSHSIDDSEILRVDYPNTRHNRGADNTISGSSPTTGVRMIQGVPQITSVLKANIVKNSDALQDAVLIEQTIPQPFEWPTDRQQQPILDKRNPKTEIEIDQLLDKLADRLEFELMRMYGSSSV